MTSLSSTMISSLRPDAVEFTPSGVTPSQTSTIGSSSFPEQRCVPSSTSPSNNCHDKPLHYGNGDRRNGLNSSNTTAGTRRDRNNSSISITNWGNNCNSPSMTGNINQTRVSYPPPPKKTNDRLYIHLWYTAYMHNSPHAYMHYLE